ncbi:M48 family metalloprotease [Hymenobacter taeanensis]|uniref:M48 family metalloprotease n=1 Tax=Hymenobacter taeanensis TaxID=2735321 RepID=A0A6M6BDY2_9BACT|nr:MULTISPECIES: M48 family metalloprotease [Hymenobacter]QJX45463.1 M48 family metalloprotease [Hymenobacter taeanensis]UOQ81291.1 M48 family metalloprotease [Hymenobacter sp. 5414T-23]
MKPTLSHSVRAGAMLVLLLPLGGSVPANRSSASPARATLPVQGAQPDPSVIAQFGLLNNTKLQSYIDSKGMQMGRISDRPADVKGFTIVDSPIINAFATPDGHVYFTRGIMAHFNNEAQFSGVLGHEIGHITARHGQKQQTRSTIANGALILGSILSKRVASVIEPASQVVGLGLLKYGRDAENEADNLGVKYSSKIGYDPASMADFFLTLQRTEQSSGAATVPTFLSTHPNSADRYQRVKKLAVTAEQQAGRQLAVNRDQYLRMIEGLPYGDNPREGFVENSVFYHPDLKFQFPVPQGWKSQNSPSQFQMAEPNGKAVQILLPAGNKSLDETAQALVQQLQLQNAQAQKTTVNNFPAVVIQGDQVGQDQQTGQQGVTASTLSYIIQDGQTLYALVGLCGPGTLNTYGSTFQRVAQGFRRLTDASKLNKQPERIRIKTAKAGQTLASALAANGVSSKRYEELGILNGMKTTDKMTAGQLFKVVGR